MKYEYVDNTKKYKIRRLGDVMLDLEVVLEEMCDKHDLQLYEILALVEGWVKRHKPDNVEKDV